MEAGESDGRYNPVMSTSTQYRYLEPNSRSSYRQLFIKGRRLTARDLYGQHVNEEPRTVKQLAADYDLPVEAVEEAIAYCRTNPPEIELDFRYDEAIAEASGMNEQEYTLHGTTKLISPQEDARIHRRIYGEQT